jgi:small subunit ribosomal protein S1
VDAPKPAGDSHDLPRLGARDTATLFPPDLEREVADALADMPAAELAELTGGSGDNGAAPGSDLTGTVVGVSGDDVFLQFGAKTQGVLPRNQFGKNEAVDVGRRVDVTVERYDGEAGLLIVNRKGAIQRATWTTLTVGSLVEGKATGVIKGGLEISLKGIRAFMPASHADVHPMKDTSELLNQTFTCEVIELDRRNKNVIVSRRNVMQRDREAAKRKLKAELEAGQLRRGIVRRITEFGAFVDLGGIDGLLHIRDLSWGTVEKVEDVVHVDQEVEVKVLKVDENRERISLGLKHALPDPWNGAAEKYPEGTRLKARVVRLANFGAFAELEPGVEGLIPISEMSWSRLKHAGEAVSAGDVVDCQVIRFEGQKRRIALSMKQAQPDPWDVALDGFTPNSMVQGKVTRLADFGAFVELVPGVEGLVHISELSDRRVRTCADVVREGQEVEARVLGVDKESHRISLSLRPADAGGGPAADPAGEARPKKKRKKPLRGGLASHFDW